MTPPASAVAAVARPRGCARGHSRTRSPRRGLRHNPARRVASAGTAASLARCHGRRPCASPASAGSGLGLLGSCGLVALDVCRSPGRTPRTRLTLLGSRKGGGRRPAYLPLPTQRPGLRNGRGNNLRGCTGRSQPDLALALGCWALPGKHTHLCLHISFPVSVDTTEDSRELILLMA